MNNKLRSCPFCGDKIKEQIGFGGITFFKCQNFGCGAVISFDNFKCNTVSVSARECFNRRAKEKGKTEN